MQLNNLQAEAYGVASTLNPDCGSFAIFASHTYHLQMK